MSRVLLFISILLMQPCRCLSEPLTNVSECIKFVASYYSDDMLVDTLTSFNEFTECDPFTFAIIYNYVTHCRNEDAAEGIYDKLADALMYNEKFENKFVEYCNLIEDANRFMNEVVSCICRNICISFENTLFNNTDILEVRELLIDKIPANIIEYYSNHNREIDFIRVIDYEINNWFPHY